MKAYMAQLIGILALISDTYFLIGQGSHAVEYHIIHRGKHRTVSCPKKDAMSQ